jgi:hypothetical protein
LYGNVMDVALGHECNEYIHRSHVSLFFRQQTSGWRYLQREHSY